ELLGELRQQNSDAALVAGWSDAEIDALMHGSGNGFGSSTEPDHVEPTEELREKWRTERGQLWLLPSKRGSGEHRLLCGSSTDSEDVAQLLGSARAAWMWTDPPYGVSYVGKTKDALTIDNDGAEGLPELLAAAFSCADGVLDEGAPIYIAH